MANNNANPAITLKRKRTFILIISIILSISIGLSAFFLMRMIRTTVTVPVAKSDVLAYSPITESDIVTVKINKSDFEALSNNFKNIATTKKQLIGKTLDYPVFAGEFFYTKRISSSTNGRYLTAVVNSPNKQILAVPVSMNGAVAGTVSPKDYVDVWGQSGNDGSAMKLLKRVQVITLRYNQKSAFLDNSADTAKDSSSDSSDKDKSSLTDDAVVLFALSDSDVAKLLPYISSGSSNIYLTAVSPYATGTGDVIGTVPTSTTQTTKINGQ